MPHAHRRDAGAGAIAARVPAALALVLLSVALGACEPHVDGNGVFREEDWSGAPPFEGLQVEDGIVADVTVGGQKSVRLSGDENVVSKVSHRVVVDQETGVATLQVWVEESYTTFHPLQLVVTIPSLSLVRAEGHSDDTETFVDAEGVVAETLHVSISDRAHVKVQGAGTGPGSVLRAVVSGRSTEEDVQAELDARAYPVANADVRLSGGARAWVKASGAVTGVAPAGTQVKNVGAGACEVVDGDGALITCLPP